MTIQTSIICTWSSWYEQYNDKLTSGYATDLLAIIVYCKEFTINLIFKFALTCKVMYSSRSRGLTVKRGCPR